MIYTEVYLVTAPFFARPLRELKANCDIEISSRNVASCRATGHHVFKCLSIFRCLKPLQGREDLARDFRQLGAAEVAAAPGAEEATRKLRTILGCWRILFLANMFSVHLQHGFICAFQSSSESEFRVYGCYAHVRVVSSHCEVRFCSQIILAQSLQCWFMVACDW